MIIRFASAASALAVAGALSAPALAQGPATAFEAAAPVMLTEKAAATLAAAAASPVVDAATGEELSGVTIAASGEAAPVILTAAGATPGLAANNGEVVVTSAAITAAAAAAAQGGDTGRSESFTVVLNQDSFFGTYPSFNALIPVSDNVDLSVYGIMWNTDAFGTGLGSDLWTEFGIGAAIYSGNFVIKPQIGLTNGALLSRGTGNGGGNFADGIVPSLTVNYSDDQFEGEFYGGYYAALRNRSNDSGALDFLHTWINAGYKFTSNFSAGAHYEVLANTRVDLPGGSASNVYEWIGPYVQFKTENGFFTRFTAGVETGGGAAGNEGDFYKLSAGFTF